MDDCCTAAVTVYTIREMYNYFPEENCAQVSQQGCMTGPTIAVKHGSTV